MIKNPLNYVIWMAVMLLLFSVMPITETALGEDVDDPDLVAEWHFDEDGGDILYDSSGNDFSGNIVNPDWVQGILGSALNLTEDSYVTFDQSPIDSQYMSVEFWIKDDGVVSDKNFIFAKGWRPGEVGYKCYIRPENQDYGPLLFCSQYPDGAWPAFGVPYSPDATWKFYTITFEHGESHFPLPPDSIWTGEYREFDLRVYMNGEEVSIVTAGFGLSSGLRSERPFIIGRNARAHFEFPLDAALDEFKIYDRVLTAEEAREHFEAYMEPEIEDLPEIIRKLELQQGLENSLISKIENTIGAIEDGNTKAAVNKLKAFINQLEAQSGKKITAEDAEMLINLASALIEGLEEQA
jgi:hypothetical protein